MALVPFSYASPFTDQLQLKERLFTVDGRHVKIQQAWKGDGKGGTDIGFGASVYPAAYVLAEYLERHPYLVRGKRVIELGTGTGFLGIAAAVLGAAEVCLTDGDEASLKLTAKNVRANLLCARCGQSSPCPTSWCDCQPVNKDGPGDNIDVPTAGDTTVDRNSDGKGAGKRSSSTADTLERGTQAVDVGGAEGAELDALQSAEATGGHGKANDTGGRNKGGSDIFDAMSAVGGRGGRGGCGGRTEPSAPARVSVQKLCWGSKVDLQAVGCARGDGSIDSGGDVTSCRSWDVVLGSDIAAFPYESAYGDLRRTIVSLVNSSSSAAPSPPAGEPREDTTEKKDWEPCGTSPADVTTAASGNDGCSEWGLSGLAPPLPPSSFAAEAAAVSPLRGRGGERGLAEEGERRRKRVVTVLLAHKRRHLSEEAFFEDLRKELGGKNTVWESGEDDIHVDFRGTGIRLHVFAVDV